MYFIVSPQHQQRASKTMPETTIPARITLEFRALTAARFYGLAEVPPEPE